MFNSSWIEAYVLKCAQYVIPEIKVASGSGEATFGCLLLSA